MSDQLLRALMLLREASELLADVGQLHLADMTDTIGDSVAIRYENFRRQEAAA